MDRLQEFFSRRVAGIPVGVIAVVVAAVILVVALRMKGATMGTDVTATDDEPMGDDIGEPENPVFEASPAHSTVIATAVEETNETWAKRAREWLVSEGGLSPSAAQRIVAKYLNSEQLTSAEWTKIDNVLSALGYPPDPPEILDVEPELPDEGGTTDDPAPSVEDPPLPPDNGSAGDTMPPTKQGTPPTHHIVKNARDNGPGELANLYYGSNAPPLVARLEAANWELGRGPWAKGTRVTIPEKKDPKFFTATAAVRGLNEIAAKNGVTKDFIKALNPGVNFPVPVGTRVRVN